jgi:adenylate cyclase
MTSNEPSHILVIEDDVLIRRVYYDVLDSEGYRVSLAGSGEEALAYLQLITPDLILLDLGLPGIDGYEVTRRIKADLSKPFIPIIMISAQADLNTSVSSLDAGADDFLFKPVELDDMLARIRAMLRLQRAQRSLSNEQRKTELLLHLTRDLGASIELEVLLTRFLDHLADAVGAIRASIILTGFLEDEILCYSSSRNPTTPLLETIVRHGVAGWAIKHREPVVIHDTLVDDRWFKRDPMHETVRSVAATPVIREGRTLGVITLVHHTPSYFSSEHIELLASVAAQSAVALESAQLFTLVQRQKGLLERRAEELRRINETNAILSELMQPDQLIRLLVHMVQQQFRYPLVTLMTRDGADLVLQSSAGMLDGISAPSVAGMRIHANGGLYGVAVGKQQTVRVDDLQADERHSAQLSEDEATHGQIIVPILLRRELLGTLDVRSTKAGAFGENDEAVLEAIVNQFSIAIGNARLLELEQQRIQQLSQVNRLSVAITAQLDAPQNLQLAADAVAIIFGVRQAGLILLDGDHEGDLLVAFHGPQTGSSAEFARALLADQHARHQLAALQDVRLLSSLPIEQLEPVRRFLAGAKVADALVVPLVANNRPAGALFIDATRRNEGFGRADIELATTVASLIMQVIENARLYRIVADERSTLNAVLSGAADPILLVGPASELLLANRAAEEQLRLDLNADRGKLMNHLIGATRNPFLDQLVPLLTNGYNNDEATELNLPQDVSYSVSVAPVRSADEQPLGRVAVLRDITAIKRLERQESERVRSVFRRYVSPVLAERLLSEGQELGRPTEREVAVLFADMRGFTSLTERMDPKILIERVLNRYFTAMTEALYAHDGTIDKFLGDGIIGVFGSPITRPDDPQRALLSAVEMQRAFAKLNAEWQSELGMDIGMGIGISYGRAVVGNIGSEQRQDYTLIGDVVNTASRLSGLARGGQIIVSYHLYDALPLASSEITTLVALGPMPIKGKQEPHLIYEVRY